MSNFTKGVLIVIASIIFCFTVVIIAFLFYINIDLEELNGEGTIYKEIVSPDGHYKAEVRLIDNGGNATTPIGQAVSVTYLKGERKKLLEETIYWEIHSETEEPVVEWIDEEMVKVNERKIDIFDQGTFYNWQKK